MTELADFVREYDCGAIYDPDKRRMIYPAGDWLESKSEWLRLTENAQRIGTDFTRSRVMGLYQSKWNALFEKLAESEIN